MQAVVGGASLVLPEVWLIISAAVFFLFAPFLPAESEGRRRTSQHLAAGATLAVLAAAFLLSYRPASNPSTLTLSLFQIDGLSQVARAATLAVGVLIVLIGWNQSLADKAGEYHACLLLVLAGVSLTASSNDLIGLFLALELVSIPTYVMLCLPRRGVAGQEAAAKYFLLSIFSSAIFLYGLAFLFGEVGSTNLRVIRQAIASPADMPMPVLLIVALLFVIGGLGFRITAAPFHFYAPDVFEGASTAGAAFLSYIPKLAGFGALLRVLSQTLLAPGSAERDWSLTPTSTVILWSLAVLTMFLGNVLALLQNNVKRMLAYSSVAHAGYMLIGLTAGRSINGSINGNAALLFYLMIYGVMTLGAFAVTASLSRDGESVETLDDLSGLAARSPLTALVMAGFMFSLTGLPPTAGFWGKFYLFLAAWSQGSSALKTLAVLLAVNAAIGGWYYLRVIGLMYLQSPSKAPGLTETALEIIPSATHQGNGVPPLGTSGALVAPRLAVGLCSILVLGLFLFPSALWRWIETAVRTL